MRKILKKIFQIITIITILFSERVFAYTVVVESNGASQEVNLPLCGEDGDEGCFWYSGEFTS